MFSKLIEKGKNYLKQEKEKKEQKKANQISQDCQKQGLDLKTLDDKTQYLVKKTTYHSDKLMNLTQNLNQAQKELKSPNVQQNMNLLKESLLYNQEIQPTSEKLEEYLKINKINDIDFQCQNFQNYLNKEILKINQENSKIQNPLFCLAIIQFHHKLGPVVEYSYPEQGISNEILDQLTYLALPDAIHNKDEDFIYFQIQNNNSSSNNNSNDNNEEEHKENKNIQNNSNSEILYGVSYFKQIQVTKEMREKDKDLTRNQMQKSICVLSRLPLFGYLVNRLAPTTKAYFNQSDFSDHSILQSAFESINTSLRETQDTQEESEVYLGTSPKCLIYQFKEKVLIILKAILLEQRIIVFSLNSQACSNFILSLLSLLPGMLYFNYKNNRNISDIQSEFRNYGLPFRLFDQKNKMLELYFTIQSLDSLKTSKSFLIGTTNTLIRGNQNADLLIDLDKKQPVEFKNQSLEAKCKLSNKEKKFMDSIYKDLQQNIQENEKSWIGLSQNVFSMDIGWNGSNDDYRHQFHTYFKEMLVELSLYQQNLKQVEQDYKSMLQQNEQFFFGENQEIQSIEQGTTNPNVSHNMDGETMMALGLSKQESSKSLFIKQMRENLLQNEKQLKRYNIKFISHWTKTDNYKFWLFNKLKDLYILSPNQGQNPQQHSKQLSTKRIMVYESGDIYQGPILNGMKHGTGILYEINNQRIYSSSFINNLKYGKTTVKSLNNDYSFEGEFEEDMKTGFGKLFIKNQIEYTGKFFLDKYEGNGVLKDNEDNVYEGEFKHGLKHGMGKIKLQNGDMYIGDFKNDLFDGQGQYVYQNGNVYAGSFKQGKKYGMGEFQYSDGKKYEGEFQNDVYEGQGHLYINDKVYQGLFSNGELVEGLDQIIKFPNGDVWSGTVVNYKMHGEGIYSKQDGTIVYAIYENDEFVQQQEDKEVQEKLKRFENNLNEIDQFQDEEDMDILQNDIYKANSNSSHLHE